ncbi:MAG TPA: hypothetical protein VF763_04230, partial [Candidatus Limnocylindrales bacterium]
NYERIVTDAYLAEVERLVERATPASPQARAVVLSGGKLPKGARIEDGALYLHCRWALDGAISRRNGPRFNGLDDLLVSFKRPDEVKAIIARAGADVDRALDVIDRVREDGGAGRIAARGGGCLLPLALLAFLVIWTEFRVP